MRIDHPLKMKALAPVAVVSLGFAALALAQAPGPAPEPAAADDPVATLVRQLELEKYKASIYCLSAFVYGLKVK